MGICESLATRLRPAISYIDNKIHHHGRHGELGGFNDGTTHLRHIYLSSASYNTREVACYDFDHSSWKVELALNLSDSW